MWPDSIIVTPLSPLLGWGFDKLIILWRPSGVDKTTKATTEALEWYEHLTKAKMRPGGEIVELVL